MRILLVEDDPELGDGLTIGLRQAGFAVDWVRDGNAADHALHAESFDLVVLDLGLPRLSGMEVLTRARTRGLDVAASVSINHLCFNEIDIGDYRTFYRLDPPLRTEDDRQAMIEGIRDTAIGAGIAEPSAFDNGIRDLYRTAEADGVFCYTFFKAFAIK